MYLTDNYPKQFVVDDAWDVFLADVDGVTVLPRPLTPPSPHPPVAAESCGLAGSGAG